MLTTPFPYIFDLLMAELKLDPILQAFWERFPCPPPWNTGLLEKVNWTNCMGPNIGHQVKILMVDKCKFDFEFDGGVPIDSGERLTPETCATPCQVMIALAGLLVLIAVLTAVVFFKFRRKSTKPDSCASPSHQTALNPHGSNKYYTSCHYAASPVIGRHVETTLRGNKMETRVLNGSSKYMDNLYTPSLQQPTPLSYAPVQKQDMCLPVSNSFNSNYRRLPEAEYSSSSASQANSDKSPIYEFIEDSASIHKDRKSRQSRDLMGFCDCEETGYGSSDTYNSERATQTLPVRHFHRQRYNSDREPCCYGGSSSSRLSPSMDRSGSPCCVPRPEHFDIDDSCMSRVPNPRRSSRTRRRPGSGSESGSIYEEGRYNFRGEDQMRPIPALHPHYFCPPELSYR